MIVFKCYMKILRQNVTLVIIYLGIFFSVALVMQMAAGKSEDSLYANTSIDIGVVKEDQGVLAQGFVDYLNTIHNVIPMKNNPEVLQENLFYRNVEYIVQIPDDFYEACIQGNQPLKVTKVPGSYSSYYVDQQISSYISTIRTYVAAGFSQEEAVQAVKTEVHKPVTKISSDSASSGSSLLYHGIYSYGFQKGIYSETDGSFRYFSETSIPGGIDGNGGNWCFLVASWYPGGSADVWKYLLGF